LKEHFILSQDVMLLSYTGLFISFLWGDFSFDDGGYLGIFILTGVSAHAMIYLSQYLRKTAELNRGLLSIDHPVLINCNLQSPDLSRSKKAGNKFLT